jgi:DNA-binding beta-propeller fold protein YncE
MNFEYPTRSRVKGKRINRLSVPLLGGVLFAALAAASFAKNAAADPAADTAPVGRSWNMLITPENQLVTPAGTQVELPGVRPNALALSPDGKFLVTAGLTHELLAVDPKTGEILQRVPFPKDSSQEEKPVAPGILNPDEKPQLSFTGLVFSPDGTRIYLANVNGDIKVFGVAKGGEISALHSFPLPLTNAHERRNEIPAGLAVSRDGKRLYVAGNLSNRLLELEAESGKVLRQWEVGVAPFDVVLAGRKAYVSNWGGRRPAADSLTGPAGRGTLVRVDARSIASEGSVSVIELDAKSATGSEKSEIVTGPHACAMALSPDGRWLVAANAGSDALSVIDTRSDALVETVTARQQPGDPFGAQPDALAFDAAGKTLYCANGSQNAVAVFHFEPHETKLLGLIPAGWFPAALAFDARRDLLCVANLKNLAAQPEKAKKGATGRGFSTKQYTGSLSLIPLPTKDELTADTYTALADLRYPLLAQAALPARADRQPLPVPERTGEAGVFKHVIYIIKENRTYDQVLGDVKEGNGEAGLCNFGERVTQRAQAGARIRAARQHVLLRHSQRGRASMDRHGHRDGLCGALIRGLAAELSRRWFRRGRTRCAGVFARRVYLERRTFARADDLRLRRIHYRSQTLEGRDAHGEDWLCAGVEGFHQRHEGN